MKKEQEINLRDMGDIVNKLVKEDRIKFEFYNSFVPLELLRVCHNKKDNTLELSFRDIQQYHINELKELNEKIEKNKNNWKKL